MHGLPDFSRKWSAVGKALPAHERLKEILNIVRRFDVFARYQHLYSDVLYAGLYSSKGASYQLLRAIERDEVHLVLSITLLFEYEDILRRNQTVLRLSDSEIERLLDDLCHRSEHQTIYFLWRPQLVDPKDDHILELAVASRTSIVVTHNTKDFKRANPFGLQAVTPKKFLEVNPRVR